VNNGHVTIKIYDSNGILVSNLVDEDKIAGTYEDTWVPNGLKGGTYLASIYSNKSLVKTVKMQVIQK
jgi:flagellar hook assembly protein FlgD